MGYIEKTDYLKESKDILTDALIDLGANINSNTSFRQYINSIDDIYNAFPKTAYQEGTNITFTNCAQGKIDFEKDSNGYYKILKGNTVNNNVVTDTQNITIYGSNFIDFAHPNNAISPSLDFSFQNDILILTEIADNNYVSTS